MNVLDLASKKVKLRKVSSTNGGEYQGPCPSCGGDDRFHVWPAKRGGSGSYWCRQCEKNGDNIQFLIDFEGYNFKDACLKLKITIPDRPHFSRSDRREHKFEPSNPAPPEDLWQERAEKLVTWANENLAGNAEVLQWLDERGITKETAAAFRLGWNPGEKDDRMYRARKAWGLPERRNAKGRPKALWIPRGLVIPTVIDGTVVRIRIRRPDPEADPRYYFFPGSSLATTVLGPDRRAFAVTESDLDAILIYARCPLVGAIPLGSVSAKPDEAAFRILESALKILVCVDFDKAGHQATQWWEKQFSEAVHWPVTVGKDPGDAFKMGMDVEGWIRAGLPPVMTIEREPTNRTATEPSEQPQKKTAPDPEQEKTAPGHETPVEIPAAVYELEALLKRNPAVVIIHTARRYSVLRNGKYVGGRIGRLAFSEEVREYLMFQHPDEEITGDNLIMREEANQGCLIKQ